MKKKKIMLDKILYEVRKCDMLELKVMAIPLTLKLIFATLFRFIIIILSYNTKLKFVVFEIIKRKYFKL
jgi:hypothetical protein